MRLDTQPPLVNDILQMDEYYILACVVSYFI